MKKLDRFSIGFSIIATIIEVFSVTISYLFYKRQITPSFKGWLVEVDWPLHKMSEKELAELFREAVGIRLHCRATYVTTHWDKIREKCRGTFSVELMNTGIISTGIRGVALSGRPGISREEHLKEIVSHYRILFTMILRVDGPFPVFLHPGEDVLIGRRNIKDTSHIFLLTVYYVALVSIPFGASLPTPQNPFLNALKAPPSFLPQRIRALPGFTVRTGDLTPRSFAD